MSSNKCKFCPLSVECVNRQVFVTVCYQNCLGPKSGHRDDQDGLSPWAMVEAGGSGGEQEDQVNQEAWREEAWVKWVWVIIRVCGQDNENLGATETRISWSTRRTQHTHTGLSEQPSVLPQWVRKSGNGIREEQGSYTRVDEVIGFRCVDEPGRQVSVATLTTNQKRWHIQKGGDTGGQTGKNTGDMAGDVTVVIITLSVTDTSLHKARWQKMSFWLPNIRDLVRSVLIVLGR